MKSKLILVFVLFFVLMGCQKQSTILDPNDSQLKPSMKDFYTLDSPVFESDHFHIKPLTLYKSESIIEGEPIIFYGINFVLAPKTDAPFELKSIRINPTNSEIKDYLTNPPQPTGLANLDSWNLTLSDLDKEFKFDKIADFIAYETLVWFNDAGQKNLETKGLTPQQIEEALKSLEVIIDSNLGKETITITFDQLTTEEKEREVFFEPYEKQ